MPIESDPRCNQTAMSSSSSHYVVDIESTAGRSQGSADRIGFCIFRVPQSLSEINQMAYRPNTVPIGPYHHRNPRFEKIQEHKRRFAIDLLNRSHQSMEKLQHFAEALKPMEEEIRKCYSEALAFNSDELLQMMVLDGCFIIELFCKYSRKLASLKEERYDPLLTEPQVLPSIMQDLTKLENQIPWFVLKCLFDLTLGSSNESLPSLSNLALSFFNRMLQRPEQVLKMYSNQEGEHLLSFLRLTYIPNSPEIKVRPNQFLRLIQPANKLHQVGIQFRPTHRESFMDIEFSNGVLKIPVLKFDYFLSCLLLNFVAFEQCFRNSSKHVTTYATFMACLLKTPADAEFLYNNDVIETYFETEERIADFFSNIGKYVVFDIRKNYLRQVFQDVNKYCKQSPRAYWMQYSRIAAVAAFMLFSFEAIQAFFAVYAYFRPRS